MNESKNQPSDDAFLDELYQHTKMEKSPEFLDAKILNEAKVNVEHQYSSVFKWQRVASVAAVMVFSIYIFFDVRDQKEGYVESELYVPAPKLQMTPKADFAAESFETDINESETSDLIVEEQLAPIDVEPLFDAPSIVLERTATKPEIKMEAKQIDKKSKSVQQEIIKEKDRETSAKKKLIEQAGSSLNSMSDGLKQGSQYHKTPQQLVMEIRLMISRLRPQRAKEIYEILKIHYEDFEVPKDIEIYMEALDKRNRNH